MESKVKIFKTISIVLLIIAIILISFIGIFRLNANNYENLIPDFSYGMEIAGTREFKFSLDTTETEKEVYVDEDGNIKGEVITEETSTDTGISLETTEETVESEDIVAEEVVDQPEYSTETRTIKSNEDSVINKESFETTKSIIQKRLETAQIPEYNLRLDNITGDFILEVPEDEYANFANELVLQQGDFQIIDGQTGVILITVDNIKSATAIYYADTSYQAYLQIEFTETGAEKLKEISNTYVQIVNEEDETETKTVELRLDGSTLLTTYFGEELSQGILQITIGEATTDYSEFIEYFESANFFANILNNGKTPNAYSLTSDNFVKSEITEEIILIAWIIFAILVLVISLYLIIKYKFKGLLSSLSGIGYIALTLLALRCTDVKITLNSLFAILGVIIVNYVFILTFLKAQKTDSLKHAYIECMKKMNMTVIPLWIVAVIFTFMTNIMICSVGMVLFWGLLVQSIYNLTITKSLYV